MSGTQTSTHTASAASTPVAIASANDTVVTGATGTITDGSGNVWTITAGGQVAVNGVADTTTRNVIELAYVMGTVWQENSSKLWWGETKPNTSWAPAAGTSTSPLPVTSTPTPTPTPTPVPTPVLTTTQTPTFEDNFTTLSLHENWQAGDNWMLIAPDTPLGRGGPNYNESGDQWWTNPYNPNTPISGIYTLAPGGGLQIALLPTPSADQAYINSQAGTNMPFVGGIINSYPTNYQKYGYWQITATMPAVPGTSFQADIENVQVTGTWPPEIDLQIFTDSAGVETVLYDVQTTSGGESWTTSSSAGFNASVQHTYGWDWESNNITFYIDHQKVWQVATPQDGSYTTNPMFLYLLTAANYIGNGDPNPASLPVHALISNVSVYASMPTWTSSPTPTPTPTPSPTPTPTPTPTPVGTPSPNDTVVKGATKTITDASGNKWTITSGGQVAVNGVADTTTANVIELAYVNGTIWQENSSKLWWGETTPTAAWAPSAGTATSPLPATPTPTPTPTPHARLRHPRPTTRW